MAILFFHFDGTANDPTAADAPLNENESITNVLKSHLLLGGELQSKTGKVYGRSHWRSFYYPGVGTYGNRLERLLNAGLAFENADIAQILQRAMLDFQTHYHDGIEHIVLVGFSRGAALARRFAALISPFLPRPMIIEAVMDTVASIGWPNLDKQQYPTTEVVFEHGASLPTNVLHALHLVALDEQRLAFRPTLMNAEPRVEEIWLSGVHSDIGGGYRSDGLSDVSFRVMGRWLTQRLSLQRLPLYLHLDQLPHWQAGLEYYQHWCQVLEVVPEMFGKVHWQQRLPHIAQLTLAPRSCHVWREDSPCTDSAPMWHKSVFIRMQCDRHYRPAARLANQALGWCS